jgi:hypothetical protein
MYLLKLVIRKSLECGTTGLGEPNAGTRYVMRFAERHALPNHPLRNIRC